MFKLTASLLLSLTAAALAQSPPDRPAYQVLRWMEDWSVLRDHDPRTTGDPFDRIKYVPLTADGDLWASFGGQARLRGELWENFDFSESKDDTYLLGRLLLHADVHKGDRLRLFVEGKSALSTDRDLPGGRRTLDVDAGDLQQAFFDVDLVPFGEGSRLTLRGGRQELLFGAQRLVSPLPWSNTMRTWDGASAILRNAGWTHHAFWTQYVPVKKYEFNDPDAQTQLWGLYNTRKALDLYLLGLHRRDPVTFNGTTGPEDRYTVGARYQHKAKESPFDLDAEAAFQFGRVDAGDVRAFMVALEGGYTFRDAAWKPRLQLGLDYASGDDAAGGDVETFNQMFPLGHKYYGFIDAVGRQNAVDLSLAVSVAPLEKLSVLFAAHQFWRASDTDALYNAGGGVVREGNLGSASEIGTELDLVARYRLDRHLTGELGLCYLFAGTFLEQSGSSSDVGFLYLEFTFNF